MEDTTLFSDKSDAQVEAEVAQTTRRIEMLTGTATMSLTKEQRTPLVRAQQCLSFMKCMEDSLLQPDSPCLNLACDLVIAIVASIRPADNPYAGSYDVEVRWNGVQKLLIDEHGARWNGVLTPFSLNEAQLSLTVYRPGARSEWGQRSRKKYDGLTETINVTFDSDEKSFRGTFQRSFEGPLPCAGKRVE